MSKLEGKALPNNPCISTFGANIGEWFIPNTFCLFVILCSSLLGPHYCSAFSFCCPGVMCVIYGYCMTFPETASLAFWGFPQTINLTPECLWYNELL